MHVDAKNDTSLQPSKAEILVFLTPDLAGFASFFFSRKQSYNKVAINHSQLE
jgi:hypothetical protein